MYLISACPDKLFDILRIASVAKKIKTLKEINISFIAYEQQVKRYLVSMCWGSGVSITVVWFNNRGGCHTCTSLWIITILLLII